MTATTYTLSHSADSDASAERVFAIWSDVNRWNHWDLGLDGCEFDGEFAAGSVFRLKPKGAPASVEARLDEVVPNQRFIDSTQLPFGSVKFIHEVAPTGQGSVITHTVVAEIRSEMADAFANTMWKSVSHDLAPSVENLARLAAQRA